MSTAMPLQNAARRKLVERTTPPIRLKDRVELASEGWLNAARAYLAPRVEERRDALRGQSLRVCEIYTGAPAHLDCPGGEAAIHIIIDDGELTVGAGEIDGADFKMRIDYNKSHWLVTAVYEQMPERAARLQREVRHLHGDIAQVEGALQPSPAMAAALSGLHDHMGRRTVTNPDVAQRIAAFGLQRHLDELEEQGYTIMENALTHAMTDELSADLARLIAENIPEKRHSASMLLERGALWQDLALHPWIHSVAQQVVGADCNLGQSIGFTKPTGLDTHQMHNDPPHPLTGDLKCNMTVIVALEDFTETSGSTLVVPGTHKLNCRPAPDARERAVKILMPKGSVAMWTGSLWHGAAIREDDGVRMSIHNTYLRNWVRTFDSYLEIDQAVLANNCPAITTLAGVDDIYGKNGHAGPNFPG